MKRKTFHSCILAAAASLAVSVGANAEPLKIAVPTALTGDAAPFGMDIKNALTLANERLGKGRYILVFEDEKCSNKDAVTVAKKFVEIDHAKYALGFPCNASLLAAAPIYERAGIVTVTSSANSGDVPDIGSHIFRLFPSDAFGAVKLAAAIGARHRRLAILTEQNEYPVMMERTVRRTLESAAKRPAIDSYDFTHGSTDFRTLATKIRASGADALFVNANTDTSFVTAMKQIREQNLDLQIYAAYIPASKVVREALGPLVNGVIYCNLPLVEKLVTPSGKELLDEFKTRYGDPQSGFPVVATSFEAFRVLDLAIESGMPPEEYLKGRRFEGGFLPPYSFDEHGAVTGIEFELQQIENQEIVTIDG